MQDDTDTENIAQTLARELAQPSILHTLEAEDHSSQLMQVALPKNFTLVPVDSEQLCIGPRRAKLTPKFSDTVSFLAYVERHRTAATVVWCDLDPQSFELKFTAVIDDHAMGAPGWRDHRATLEPAMSAEWKAWMGRNTRPMSQVDFAQWIQEHEEDINSKAEGMPTSLAMLKMATEFVANEERSVKSIVKLQSGGARLTFIADADKGTEEAMAIFEKFALGMPVFHGADAWALSARLKYTAAQGKVSFRFELIRPDKVHASAAKRLLEVVKDGLGETPLLMGRST
jgi:uncharacterized protein YfdQ (DUF2303 family)